MNSRVVSILPLFIAACALDPSRDTRFNDWLRQTETRCQETNGPLPIDGPEARKAFLELSYHTYYGDLDPEIFADRLMIKYPDHRLVISCIASSFPR